MVCVNGVVPGQAMRKMCIAICVFLYTNYTLNSRLLTSIHVALVALAYFCSSQLGVEDGEMQWIGTCVGLFV